MMITKKYEKELQRWYTGGLKNSENQVVNSRPQALQVASNATNQSFNDKRTTDMKTIIPSSLPDKIKQVPQMQVYVKNGPKGQAATQSAKMESPKKSNPAFFKKQSDRKYG